MNLEQLIIELEENKEELSDREQKFIESVCEFYYANGYVSDKQREWLEVYYQKLQGILNEQPNDYTTEFGKSTSGLADDGFGSGY